MSVRGVFAEILNVRFGPIAAMPTAQAPIDIRAEVDR